MVFTEDIDDKDQDGDSSNNNNIMDIVMEGDNNQHRAEVRNCFHCDHLCPKPWYNRGWRGIRHAALHGQVPAMFISTLIASYAMYSLVYEGETVDPQVATMIIIRT